jgi:hypothetical protein
MDADNWFVEDAPARAQPSQQVDLFARIRIEEFRTELKAA